MEKISAINGRILSWARKECNFSITDIAVKMKQDEKTIINWEEGNDFPSYRQLDIIASYYKKPVAVFFFPSPPKLQSIKASLRTLPEYVSNNISPNTLQLMNDARVKQINLYELYDNQNPARMEIYKLQVLSNTKKTAQVLRNILSVTIEAQKKLRSPQKAFETWRDKFTEYGIYVFKNAFRDDNISGFCIYDEVFPVIYINNSMPHTRQLFTLFHEYFHIISRTSGIDLEDDSYISSLDRDSRKIETSCNRFSAEFLVPDSDFNSEIYNREINETTITSLANKYSVSREVIMRKMLDRGLINDDFYSEKRAQFLEESSKSKKNSSGGNYYNTQIAYLGNQYLHIAYESYRLKKIDRFKLAEYLNVKASSLSKLESTWIRRG